MSENYRWKQTFKNRSKNVLIDAKFLREVPVTKGKSFSWDERGLGGTRTQDLRNAKWPRRLFGSSVSEVVVVNAFGSLT